MNLIKIDINMNFKIVSWIKLLFVEGIYMFKKKDTYLIEKESIRLDSASLARDIAEINNKLEPTKILHKYTIRNQELICDLFYEGVVRREVDEMYFTFATTNQYDYEDMDCYAIEYIDGNERRQIPRLIGIDGQIKKLALRFSEMKSRRDVFNVMFHINLGKCITSKREYILSQIKYAKATMTNYDVEIYFEEDVPNDIRVYELKKGKMRYVRDLSTDNNVFKDIIGNSSSISLRAYIFDRKGDVK